MWLNDRNVKQNYPLERDKYLTYRDKVNVLPVKATYIYKFDEKVKILERKLNYKSSENQSNFIL